MQGIPNDLTCFLNGPLQIVENQIVLLVPDNPLETIPQKEPHVIEPFKFFA
jgi:hypothetical protein